MGKELKVGEAELNGSAVAVIVFGFIYRSLLGKDILTLGLSPKIIRKILDSFHKFLLGSSALRFI